MTRRDRQLSPLFTWRTMVASSDCPLTSTQRHVALTLSLHMSERGDSCYPSVQTLADETALGISTVRDALRRINETGWLERDIRGGRESNLYRATVPRQLPAGSVEQGDAGESAITPPGAGGQPSGPSAVTPPGAGPESVIEDVSGERHGPRHQQQDEKNPSREASLRSAAALVGEPPGLLEVVQALERFRTRDISSVRVVEPLAMLLPSPVFHEVVERALRRESANDVGLLVTLLRTAIAERRKVAIDQITVAVAEPKRRDPEAFVRRLVALPSQATLDQVRSFVGQYVDDQAELDRLVTLAGELLAEPPRKQVERWIREVSPEIVDLAVVHREIDEFVDEWGDADYVERSGLHELAEEVRELHVAGGEDVKEQAA